MTEPSSALLPYRRRTVETSDPALCALGVQTPPTVFSWQCRQGQGRARWPGKEVGTIGSHPWVPSPEKASHRVLSHTAEEQKPFQPLPPTLHPGRPHGHRECLDEVTCKQREHSCGEQCAEPGDNRMGPQLNHIRGQQDRGRWGHSAQDRTKWNRLPGE